MNYLSIIALVISGIALLISLRKESVVSYDELIILQNKLKVLLAAVKKDQVALNNELENFTQITDWPFKEYVDTVNSGVELLEKDINTIEDLINSFHPIVTLIFGSLKIKKANRIIEEGHNRLQTELFSSIKLTLVIRYFIRKAIDEKQKNT